MKFEDNAISRMALAAAKDSLPKESVLFNRDELDVMLEERIPYYRELAIIMLVALFKGESI